MLLKGVSWAALIACAIFYGVVFTAVRYQVTMEHLPLHRGQLSMLLFLLPGGLCALTSRQAPLSVALFGPLLATPFCIALIVLGKMELHSFWQEVAFTISAIFWCGLGALGVMLGRTLLEMRQGK